MKSVYNLLRNKYYFDEFYNATVIRGVLGLAKGSAKFDNSIVDGAVNGVANLTLLLSKASKWFDDTVVDGSVNGVAWISQLFGSRLRKLQTGTIENYVAFLIVGIMVFFIFQALF